MLKSVVIIMLLLVGLLPVTAQVETPPDPAQYTWTEVATGLARPIYMTNAGDGSNRMFIVLQTGQILIMQDGQVLDTPFIDLSPVTSQAVVSSYSERGLLGLDFHPDYANNGQFFVHYNNPGGETVIARYQVSADNPNAGDPASGEVLFTHPQPFANHNGGQIAFGPDGYLYIGLGDGGSAADPQNHGQRSDTLLGNILRIDVDNGEPYSIPDDNPIATVNPGLAPEIWAWGLRNPWRFSFDSATGDLYIADVGQNQWEEINFQPADSPGGENYGWRVFEASTIFSGEPDPGNTVFPIAEYDHSQGCSVTGGYVYRGADLPAMDGVYLFGDWCSGNIWASYRTTDNTWETMPFQRNTGYNISSFGESETGELYLVDYRGRILQLVAS